jgi:hypothetical protein
MPMRRRTPRPLRPCSNCGRVQPIHGAERCGACYQYRHRHGVDRPPAGLRTPIDPHAPCRSCGQPIGASHRTRCGACYIYWRRHGVERGAGPILPGPSPAAPRACQTCGQLSPLLTRGRCRRCYSYWYRLGRERPAHLWAAGSP